MDKSNIILGDFTTVNYCYFKKTKIIQQREKSLTVQFKNKM